MSGKGESASEAHPHAQQAIAGVGTRRPGSRHAVLRGRGGAAALCLCLSVCLARQRVGGEELRSVAVVRLRCADGRAGHKWRAAIKRADCASAERLVALDLQAVVRLDVEDIAIEVPPALLGTASAAAAAAAAVLAGSHQLPRAGVRETFATAAILAAAGQHPTLIRVCGIACSEAHLLRTTKDFSELYEGMSGKGESVLVRLTPPSRPAARQHAPSSPPQRDSAAARGCSVYALEASQRHAQVRSCRPRKAEKSSADVSMGGTAALAIGLLLASDAGRSGAEAAANSSQHGARRRNRIVLTQPRAVWLRPAAPAHRRRPSRVWVDWPTQHAQLQKAGEGFFEEEYS